MNTQTRRSLIACAAVDDVTAWLLAVIPSIQASAYVSTYIIGWPCTSAWRFVVRPGLRWMQAISNGRAI
jgi:hypothetical protein